MAYSERSARPGLLEMRSAADGGTHVVALAGELDAAECPEVEAELTRVEANGAQRIVVDLSAVKFIDSVGLGLLVAAMRRSEQDSGRLRFVPCQSEDVQRLLFLCGLRDQMPLVGDEKSA
jgi:anti-sigma B factor antagonist